MMALKFTPLRALPLCAGRRKAFKVQAAQVKVSPKVTPILCITWQVELFRVCLNSTTHTAVATEVGTDALEQLSSNHINSFAVLSFAHPDCHQGG